MTLNVRFEEWQLIKPYKAPLIQQETDVNVKPKHWDRVIEMGLARTAPGPAPARIAGKARELSSRTPPNAATIQNGS
jgi:hypothetical protein